MHPHTAVIRQNHTLTHPSVNLPPVVGAESKIQMRLHCLQQYWGVWGRRLCV